MSEPTVIDVDENPYTEGDPSPLPGEDPNVEVVEDGDPDHEPEGVPPGEGDTEPGPDEPVTITP